MAAYEELTDAELYELPTHRLYNIYKLYRKSDKLISGSTRYDEYYDAATSLAQRHQRIQQKCEFIKSVLDSRGHIPREDKSKTSKPAKHLSGVSYVEEWEARRGLEPAAVRQGSIKNPEDAIGLQVYKKSKKPFKSKNLYNTVKSVTVNPHTGRVAFDFEEDSSIVDAHLCHLRKVKS